MTDVLIVGAGPAGLACALWCRRLGLTTRVLEAAPDAGGQLNQIPYPIADYPGSQATGAELRDHMLAAARAAGANVQLGTPVTHVSAATRTVQVGSTTLVASALVLATGGSPRPLGVPGEAEMHRRGETYRGSRDVERLRGRAVVIVGGGDRAVENALLLDAGGAHVTLVHRRDRLRAQSRLLAQLQERPQITQRTGAEVLQILGATRTEAVELRQNNSIHTVPAEAVLVYIGLQPNTGLVQGQLALTPDGRIQTTNTGHTTVRSVYALGDVAVPSAYSSVSTCVGQAMVVAKQIALAGAR